MLEELYRDLIDLSHQQRLPGTELPLLRADETTGWQLLGTIASSFTIRPQRDQATGKMVDVLILMPELTDWQSSAVPPVPLKQALQQVAAVVLEGRVQKTSQMQQWYGRPGVIALEITETGEVWAN